MTLHHAHCRERRLDDKNEALLAESQALVAHDMLSPEEGLYHPASTGAVDPAKSISIELSGSHGSHTNESAAAAAAAVQEHDVHAWEAASDADIALSRLGADSAAPGLSSARSQPAPDLRISSKSASSASGQPDLQVSASMPQPARSGESAGTSLLRNGAHLAVSPLLAAQHPSLSSLFVMCKAPFPASGSICPQSHISA